MLGFSGVSIFSGEWIVRNCEAFYCRIVTVVSHNFLAQFTRIQAAENPVGVRMDFPLRRQFFLNL